MTLRNAFTGLATEAKQDFLATLLNRLIRATTYARTSDDQMRVTVANGHYAYQYGTYVWWAGTYASWYAPGAPNSMDAREQQIMSSSINVTQAMQRWTVT